jgi:hypothetical protein
MEQSYPESGTPRILQSTGRVGHVRSTRGLGTTRFFGRVASLVALLSALAATPASGQEPQNSTTEAAHSGGARWWQLFAAGFASSIVAHEGAHIAASYAVGGRPTFGLNEGRPTIYSGIDASLQPRKQFIFSSAGLTVQNVIDEVLLDSPHHSAGRAGAFERGMLAGGIATSLFYVTIGRTGSVSDVDFMARTSTLSKTSISAIYGGVALLHAWRIAHNNRYAEFFARPDPYGGMRVGLTLDR